MQGRRGYRQVREATADAGRARYGRRWFHPMGIAEVRGRVRSVIYGDFAAVAVLPTAPLKSIVKKLAMPLRKIIPIVLLCTAGAACAIAWMIANSPRATGKIVSGEVIYCGEQKRTVEINWCMVRLDPGTEMALVDMPRTFPGQKLVLMETRTSITKRTRFIIQKYGNR